MRGSHAMMVLAVLIVAACSNTPSVPSGGLKIGDPIPGPIVVKLADADRIGVLVLLDEADCLACSLPAYQLRRISSRTDVPIDVHVFGGSAARVRDFFNTERIDVRVLNLSDDDVVQLLGHTREATVFVIRDGDVAERIPLAGLGSHQLMDERFQRVIDEGGS